MKRSSLSQTTMLSIPPPPLPLSASSGHAVPQAASGFVPPPSLLKKRDRLWELSTNLHCSIIGTCLTTADLRSLLAKAGYHSARTASEHDLHGQAVSRASRKDDGGKLLHKLLDRRHERVIARFAKAETADAVRALWREALARGEIPGAYWAALSHPATDHPLVQEVYGEVHMLSHLVGRSVRADLRRLSDLEAEVLVHADAAAEQEARIRSLTDEKVALLRRLDEATASSINTSDRNVSDQAGLVECQQAQIARLTEQLSRANAHARAEGDRRCETERALQAAHENARSSAERAAALAEELAVLEAMLEEHLSPDDHTAGDTLNGLTLLYVGGRPRQVAQARLLIARMGGRFLTHDGGIEDNATLLPGLVAQADAVLFPVDCISHDAVGWLKRTCRERAIQFLPLRTASLAAIANAVTGLRARVDS